MLRIIDAKTAQATLLKRTPPDELPVPASLLERIAAAEGLTVHAQAALLRLNAKDH